jgi:hypothetical protein
MHINDVKSILLGELPYNTPLLINRMKGLLADCSSAQLFKA